MKGDTVADFEIFDAFTDLHDGAGGFVSEDARGWNGAVMDFFDVGGTHTAGGDFDQEFAGLDFGNGNGFDPQIVWAAIYDRLHGGGNCHGKGLRWTTDHTDFTDWKREFHELY
jgi:hypothetical protein